MELPLRLEGDTISEVVFEIRFEPAVADTADLLPGLLFPSLKSTYPKLIRLPAAEIPAQLRQQQPNLMYRALHALQGRRKRVMVGDRVIGLSVNRPYPGWSGLTNLIHEVLEAAKTTSAISRIERAALRYTNVIRLRDNLADLSPLKLRFELGPFQHRGDGTKLRAEISHNECLGVVQVIANATVTTPEGDSMSGLVLDIDVHATDDLGNFWADSTPIIERLHQTEKEIFFGLLTEESITQLGPIWK